MTTAAADLDVQLLDRVGDHSAALHGAVHAYGAAMHDLLMSTADDGDDRLATLTALLGAQSAIPDLVGRIDQLTAAVRELGG